jgi:hypothetical protein
MQLSLRQNGISDVQSRVLPDIGAIDVQFLEDPIIQLSPDLEL